MLLDCDGVQMFNLEACCPQTPPMGCSGPCYRCLFPVAPKPESCSRCSDAGVLGVIPGIIGSLQALECIKILAEVGQAASRKLVIFDGLAMRFHAVKLRARSVAF